MVRRRHRRCGIVPWVRPVGVLGAILLAAACTPQTTVPSALLVSERPTDGTATNDPALEDQITAAGASVVESQSDKPGAGVKTETSVSAPVAASQTGPSADPPPVAKAAFSETPRPSAGGGSLFALLSANANAGQASKTTASSTRATVRRPSASLKRSGKRMASASGGSQLPGVQLKSLFGIGETRDVEKRAKSADTRVAFVPNLGRKGTHGLVLQRPHVRVGCFPRGLVGLLRRVERRYGKPVIVTSGYRSARRNRMAGGARRSTHVRCMAADIQVKGVSKWRLAKYLRSLPGRGGVGTYCHTKSVHIDIGKPRAWHYCKRRRSRRRH